MKIEHYRTARGRVPYAEWFESLEHYHREAIDRRIYALEFHDHFGDFRSLKGGLSELRFVGVGLRVYFVRTGQSVVLLGGSDKKSQLRAIRVARSRMEELKTRKS